MYLTMMYSNVPQKMVLGQAAHHSLLIHETDLKEDQQENGLAQAWTGDNEEGAEKQRHKKKTDGEERIGVLRNENPQDHGE